MPNPSSFGAVAGRLDEATGMSASDQQLSPLLQQVLQQAMALLSQYHQSDAEEGGDINIETANAPTHPLRPGEYTYWYPTTGVVRGYALPSRDHYRIVATPEELQAALDAHEPPLVWTYPTSATHPGQRWVRDPTIEEANAVLDYFGNYEPTRLWGREGVGATAPMVPIPGRLPADPLRGQAAMDRRVDFITEHVADDPNWRVGGYADAERLDNAPLLGPTLGRD